MTGLQCAAFGVTRTLENDEVIQPIGGAASPSSFQLFIKVTDPGVYIGGEDMLPGTDFPSGGISVEGGFSGYELTPDKEYQLTIYDTPAEGSFALFMTTTSETPVVVSLWMVPRSAPGGGA